MIRHLEVFVLWLMGGLWWVSNLLLKPKVISSDKVFRMEEARGRFDKKAYRRTQKTKFRLASDFGYELSCELLEPDKERDVSDRNNPADNSENTDSPCQKIAIICHGFTWAKYGCLIYAEIYLELGYKVLIYDHRNHGFSGKAYTSMGYYEKFDLKKVIDWCYNEYGPSLKLVTHGESMGAATVLMHLGVDDRVQCVIADCGYSDLKELLKYQMRQFYYLPRFLIPVESLITFLRAGFWYREVSPIQIVRKTEKPILFIHGKQDCFVPTDMSKRMYDCKKRNKGIYLVAGAEHAQSGLVNREGYRMRVQEFLQKYMKE